MFFIGGRSTVANLLFLFVLILSFHQVNGVIFKFLLNV